MPRGPFQGTWVQGARPTVVNAPDAIVFINGEQDILGCSSCRRRMDFNKFITSIQVDLNVDSVPGSATVSMSVPRHIVDDFFFDGNPIITPMMEIEIYAKGFFVIEGVPQYYPIFWGMVNDVSDSYSGGEHSVTISCSDILKWWELCKMNINPAYTQAKGSLGKSIFGNVFFGMNPYDIIWTLAQQSYGDIVIGSGSLVSTYKEDNQKSTFNHALTDIMLYWTERFSKIRSNLLLYGTRGNAVRGDLLYAHYEQKGPGKSVGGNSRRPFASQAVRQANGGDNASQLIYDPTDPDVTAFRTQFTQAGQINYWTAEYQTKLELAQAAKEAIGFEFYMDVTGDIVFKPPFYNLDVLSNKPVSWIQDIDIIDWDLSDSESEVVTQIQLQGSFGGNMDYGFSEEATPFTSVTDYHLLRKYGWRTQTYNSEFMGAPLRMFYMGLDLIDRYNSKRFRGTVNIPMRAELRLGFPVYLASKDQIWYISGISHNLQFGGRAQTTLSLTAKRQKFIAPRGLGTIELTGYKGPKSKDVLGASDLGEDNVRSLTAKQLRDGGRFFADVGEAAELPPGNSTPSAGGFNPYAPAIVRHPKTGRIVGYPNVVMAYTRPFDPPPDSLRKLSGRKSKGAGRKIAKSLKKEQATEGDADVKAIEELYVHTKEDQLREQAMNNRYQYGLNSAGVYTYMHDKSKVIREVVMVPVGNITYADDAIDEANKVKKGHATGMLRPVSDERGFEVIGHFKYGRNVALRDGALVINENKDGPNQQAVVNTQLALSGDLHDVLRIQSRGISTVTTTFPNPSRVIATLQPEDLQSAATFNPEASKYEFTNEGKNFIDAAPLGSPEQKGSINTSDQASVEASQFSHALTLAEMSVQEAMAPNQECICLLGRSDLAFINVGYQVKTFNSSGSDTSILGAGTSDQTTNDLFDGRIDAENAVVEEATLLAQEKYQRDKAAGILDESPVSEEDFVAATVEYAQHEAGLKYDAENAAAYEAAGISDTAKFLAEAASDGRPVGSREGFTALENLSRVEDFLAGLYSALDTGHQHLEKELRGELIDGPRINPEKVRFGQQDNNPGGFAPPFNVPGRGLGGDPEALAKAGAQGIDEIEKSWNEFGDKLNANTERARLQGETKRLQDKIQRLLAEKESLNNAKETGSTRVELIGGAIGAGAGANDVDPFSIDVRLKSCQTEMDKALQDLAKAQQDLTTLNQEFPA